MTPSSLPSSAVTVSPSRSGMKYSPSSSSIASSLGIRSSDPLSLSTSSILFISSNPRMTNFLKNLTLRIFSTLSSRPVSIMTCLRSRNLLGSSVVGNTFTSPRSPCVPAITPTRNLDTISFLIHKAAAAFARCRRMISYSIGCSVDVHIHSDIFS